MAREWQSRGRALPGPGRGRLHSGDKAGLTGQEQPSDTGQGQRLQGGQPWRKEAWHGASQPTRRTDHLPVVAARHHRGRPTKWQRQALTQGRSPPADCRAPGNRQRLGLPETAGGRPSGKLLTTHICPVGSSLSPHLVQTRGTGERRACQRGQPG